MKAIESIYLLLGTNLGDRKANLTTALQYITLQIGAIEKASSVYESEAWGENEQPLFLNQVVSIQTSLPPEELLHHIQAIEQQMGRVRIRKWGERVIDIDILYYFNQVVATKQLQIPHPGIPDRRFTLAPLCEMDAEAVHPVLHKTQLELLNECNDNLNVWLWRENPKL